MSQNSRFRAKIAQKCPFLRYYAWHNCYVWHTMSDIITIFGIILEQFSTYPPYILKNTGFWRFFHKNQAFWAFFAIFQPFFRIFDYTALSYGSLVDFLKFSLVDCYKNISVYIIKNYDYILFFRINLLIKLTLKV